MSRSAYAITAAVASLSIVTMSAVAVAPRVIWNASASVPIGFYTVRPVEMPESGELVAVMPDKPLADFLVARGYLGRDVPLLKRVMALPRQTVCRNGRSISVDAKPLGDALDRDRRGRPLPVWRGCRRIGRAELFLMNPNVPDSMDGRYFGPLPAQTVIGHATPLYTDEAGDGRFVWLAATR